MKTPVEKKTNRMRSVPPPPTFSLFALADDTLLSQIEVAGFWRRAVTTIEKARYEASDGLEWKYVDGFPRCTAGSLKKRMQGDPTVRRPEVPNNPHRDPKKSRALAADESGEGFSRPEAKRQLMQLGLEASRQHAQHDERAA